MKKKVLMVVILTIVFLVTSQPVRAQYERFNLALSFGTLTDDSFSFKPFLWTSGLNLDLYLSENIVLSPEFFIIVHNFNFDAFFLAPAALLNFDFGGFMVGAGVTKFFLVGSAISGAPSSDPALKLNVGYIGEGIRLTAYIITPFSDLFKYNTLGASLGFFF
jgi:hypothetical protein